MAIHYADIFPYTSGQSFANELNSRFVALKISANRSLQLIGAWNNATFYEKGDVVSYNGVKWVALVGSTNNVPAEGAGWTSLGGVPTGAKNLFYATPANAEGAAVLRTISGADLPAATTTAKGAVQFAANGSATAGRVPGADDTRLSDARTPTAHAVTHASGGTDPLTPADIGLDAVDNTSDADKPVSSATAAALTNKADVGHHHNASEIDEGVFDLARLPILPSSRQIVSSGDLTALTLEQKADIGNGTTVTITDGRRFVYSGTGDKTLESSYVLLADVTPAWEVIENRPAQFPPVAHGHGVADINGLGNAATRNVGTGVGTVARGDDLANETVTRAAADMTLQTEVGNRATKTFDNLSTSDKPVGRGNLGLGDAATRNAGVAGGVANYDDARFGSSRNGFSRFDDFVNGINGSVFLPAATTNTNVVSVNGSGAPDPPQDAIGIVALQVLANAVANNNAKIATGADWFPDATTQRSMSCEFRAMFNVLSDSTNRIKHQLGFAGFSSHDFDARSFGHFKYDSLVSPNWLCCTVEGSTITTIDSGIPVAANTWFRLKIECDYAATNVKFRINDALVATSTTNIPAPLLTRRCALVARSLATDTVTTVTRIMIDYCDMKIQTPAPR